MIKTKRILVPEWAESAIVSRISGLLAGVEATDGLRSPVDVGEALDRVADRLAVLRESGRKVMIVGNGGSASIAGHLQMDLCNSARVRALAFQDAPVLTALANDHGYEDAFARLVTLWAEPGDELIAISSSGRSPNILKAVAAARERDCAVVTFSGFSPENPLRSMGTVNFHVASHDYGDVEVTHQTLTHVLSDRLLPGGPRP